MLRYAVIAAVGALSAAGAAKALIAFQPAAPVAAAEVAQAPPQLRQLPDATVQRASGSAAALVKSPDGHFWAEGAVNGRQVRFLVDTGASAVALTPEDARRLGVLQGLDYSVEVSTANGKTRAARVVLDSVSVAGARVAGVEAFVVEKGLDHSLLGMTYLGRLSRFEATQGSLILRP